jgi:uncharacterized protein
VSPTPGVASFDWRQVAPHLTAALVVVVFQPFAAAADQAAGIVVKLRIADNGKSQQCLSMQPGGTKGGTGEFIGGLALTALGFWLILDSVQVHTGRVGWFSGVIGGARGGAWGSTSMGIVFVPFLIGVFVLFFDARAKWAWFLSVLGLLVVLIEILSRIQFVMNSKTSHVLLMLGMIAGGAGLMFKAYLSDKKNHPKDDDPD